MKNLSKHLAGEDKTTIEFELTKVTSDLIQKIKDIDGVSSVARATGE
jgi:hypothetical protein